MSDLDECFVRDRFGAWRCIAPATLDLPGGRVQITPGTVFTRGTRFMNVDVARHLDERLARSAARGAGEAASGD